MIYDILFGIGVLFLLFILWVVYQFIIKLYWTAYKLKKMDPTLKLYVKPFTGLQGVQKDCLQKYGDSHRFLKDMIKQNPDQKAYLTNLGNLPFLILCDPQLIKQLCLEHKKFKKFNIFKHSDKIYQKAIFFVPNDEWAKQRNIISHSFSHDSLKKMIPIMTKCLNTFIQRINKHIEQSPQKRYTYRVLQESELVIGDALVRTFFSQQAANKQVLGQSLTLAMAQFTATMFQQSRTGINLFTNLIFGQQARRISFNKKDKQLQQLIDAIKVQCEAIVDDRITKYTEDSQKDFLNHYIGEMINIDKQIQAAQKQGKPHKLKKITRQQIVHQLAIFYFAGIDTTGHLVAMGIYAAAQYPECYAKLVQQIKRIVPSVEQMTYEQCQQMEYMGKFLDECLRMWAPATGVLNRLTTEQMTIGPYKLPVNFNVGTNILGNMYNEKYYKNPQKFDPQRWNDKSMQTAQPYSFIPFSAGPRSCIGKYLGLMQSKVILTHFLYHYDIKRTERPLRMYAKFLYEPFDQDLVYFYPGGIKATLKQN